MADLPVRPISPQERQVTVDRLCAHYTADHLETEEFERRLDLAYAARSGGELTALVRDLPALEARESGEAADPAHAPAPAPAPGPRVDTSRAVSEHKFMLAVMGGAERAGKWTPPRRMTVLSMMGGAGLDFRDATFAAPEIQVTVVTIMGGTEIIVPPGVHVECNGVAIMGGFGSSEPGQPATPGAPVIKINGLAMMGGVEVTERLPGESAREARKRLKAERKARQREMLSSGSED